MTTRGRKSTLACVRVRFQRHDVLPYAFCFNFLEATGFIPFPLPIPLLSLSFFLLFSLSPACPPIPRHGFRYCSLPRGSSAKCTTVVFSTVDAARYISSSSPNPPYLPTAFLHPPTPCPTPHRALSRSFSSYPFIPSTRRALSYRHPSVGVKG